MTIALTDSLRIRFNAKVDRRGPDDCWLWTAGKRTEYGCIKIAGKCYDSHRVAVMLDGREIPAGMIVMHTCDNPACCNPAHLQVATYSANTKDAIGKGRHVVPSLRETRTEPMSDEEIRTLVDEYRRGVSERALRQKYRVAKTTLNRMLKLHATT